MTKAELMKLAMTIAEANSRLAAWSMMQRPEDAEKRLRQDAEYKIAQSVAWKAQAQYDAAIRDLSAADIDQIMREEA
jgi:hypothetical protein